MGNPVTGTKTSRELTEIIGSTKPEAIDLGRSINTKRKIRYGGDQHILVFGPNGKGKGTKMLIPNLLQMSGASVVVVDPKGELAAVTAAYRRTLGPVHIINPFGLFTDIYPDLRSSGFNPLAQLDYRADSFNADASLLAAALITDDDSGNSFFPQTARALLATLIMFAVIEKADPSVGMEFRGPPPRELAVKGQRTHDKRAPLGTLARVRELVSMASSEGNAGTGFTPRGIPKLAEKILDTGFPHLAALRNKAGQFVDWARDLRSVASTARTQTEAFDDPPIARDLSKTGIDFRDIKKAPITVYLVLPPDMVLRQAKWLRLVLSSAIRSVLRDRKPGEPKVWFMIDEFYALGHLEIISTVWALTRGYGVQMMPVVQDIHQLKELYPKTWETFVGMAGAVVSFAPNELATAKWLSDRAGQITRLNIAYNSGTSTGGTSEGYNYSAQLGPLLTPHQLIGLPEPLVAISFDGLRHIAIVDLPAYYDVRQIHARRRVNPYYPE